MPLDTIEDPFELSSFDGVKQNFVIFYSSRDRDGKMWCPDCRNVEEIIERTFAPADGPTGLIVYVGQPLDWKTRGNFFRAAPWRIRSIPTVVRLHNAKEVGRLVEDEISSDLSAFVSAAPPSPPPLKNLPARTNLPPMLGPPPTVNLPEPPAEDS